MPTYILLSTLTPEGRQTLHRNPERLEEVNREITEFGCKVCRPSGVRVLNKIYVGIMLLLSGGSVWHPSCLGHATTTSFALRASACRVWDTGGDYREPARRLSSNQPVT